MKECVWAIYFSPTGGTKKAAFYLAESLGKEVKEVDLSAPDFNGAEFKKDDLVIVAAPAFGGRIPALMAERLKCTAGKGAAAVTAAVYGNRAYEDALVELNDALEEQGFEPFASAAVLAEHSMVREVAAGRPDAKDHEELSGFGAQILKKLEAAEITRPQVPGNRPYKEWKKMPAVPVNGSGCTGCGLCAGLCPSGAISKENPSVTDPKKCILCLRCIAVCPSGAKKLPEPVQEMLNQKLLPLKGIRKENELFL